MATKMKKLNEVDINFYEMWCFAPQIKKCSTHVRVKYKYVVIIKPPVHILLCNKLSFTYKMILPLNSKEITFLK